MEADDFANKIFKIIRVLEKNEGVALFASYIKKNREGKGFEGWLKVELSGLLNHYGKVLPEENRIDIVFNDEWAISLKDIKTKVDTGRSNLLINLNELKELKYSKYSKTYLVFLTFSPLGKKKNYDEKSGKCLREQKSMPRIFFLNLLQINTLIYQKK